MLRTIAVLAFASVAAIAGGLILRAWQRPPPVPAPVPALLEHAGLLQDLQEQRYEQLEATLAGLRREFDADPAREDAIFLAYENFQGGGAAMRQQLDRWVEARPQSLAARSARATHLVEAAWLRRGARSRANTTDEQMEEFQELLGRAVVQVRAVLDDDPRDPVANHALLRFAKGRDAVRGCLDKGEEVTRQLPASYRLWRFIVACLEPRWGGSYEAIEKLAQAAQGQAARNPRLRTLLGMPHWARGRDLEQDDPAAALAQYDLALGYGVDEMYLSERFSVHLALERFEEALADAVQLRDQFPHAESKDRVKLVLDRYRAQAMDLHSAGDTRAAIAAYGEILRHVPDDAEILYWRGKAHAGLDHADEALGDFQRVIALTPDDLRTLREADRVLALQGRWDEILAMWNPYIERNPQDAEAIFERGGTHFHNGDVPAAGRDAQRACSLGKQEACVWAQRIYGRS